MSHKVNTNICNWDEMPITPPIIEIDRLKTNWLPLCINGVQWYVAEVSNFNNTTGVETTITKVYKQGTEGTITNTSPIGTRQEGYCNFNREYLTGCEYSTHTLNPILNLNAAGTTITYTSVLFNNNPPSTPTLGTNYWTKAIIDWGDGEFDLLNSANFGSSITHTPPENLPSGTYEAIVYIQNEDNEWYVYCEREWSYNQSTNAVTSGGAVAQGFTFYRKVRNLIQVRNENTGVITYELDGGTPTTINPLNSFSVNCQKPQGESSITHPILSNGQSLTEIAAITPLENASPNRIIGAIANAVTINTNPTFVSARDVTVYNSKNVTVAFEYTTTINGTFHRVNIPAGGTWSNTLKRDNYTNEGTYVSGRIITAYGATTAAGEININWTT